MLTLKASKETSKILLFTEIQIASVYPPKKVIDIVQYIHPQTTRYIL